jgi:hypothetical protein
MDNRQKWTVGMAVLGGIAASQGQVSSPPDIIFGALLWAGITFGIASLVISQRARLKTLENKTNDNQRVSNMTANYSDADISQEMKDFLQTLEIVPGRYDGWYKDPSNLYKLRYFSKGKWTLAVSDSESAEEKSAALAMNFTPTTIVHTVTPTEHPVTQSNSQIKSTNVVPSQDEMNQRIEQLERVAELRRNGMISEIEHDKLKSEILRTL